MQNWTGMVSVPALRAKDTSDLFHPNNCHLLRDARPVRLPPFHTDTLVWNRSQVCNAWITGVACAKDGMFGN